MKQKHNVRTTEELIMHNRCIIRYWTNYWWL